MSGPSKAQRRAEAGEFTAGEIEAINAAVLRAEDAIFDIVRERVKQHERHFLAKDDTRSKGYWCGLLNKLTGTVDRLLPGQDARPGLVKVAATAVAAIEAIDRRRAQTHTQGGPINEGQARAAIAAMHEAKTPAECAEALGAIQAAAPGPLAQTFDEMNAETNRLLQEFATQARVELLEQDNADTCKCPSCTLRRDLMDTSPLDPVMALVLGFSLMNRGGR